MLKWGLDDLLPIPDDDLLDTLAWSLRHNARSVRALMSDSTSLATCRHIARLQLEHLQRSGVLFHRQPRRNFGHFKPQPDSK